MIETIDAYNLKTHKGENQIFTKWKNEDLIEEVEYPNIESYPKPQINETEKELNDKNEPKLLSSLCESTDEATSDIEKFDCANEKEPLSIEFDLQKDWSKYWNKIKALKDIPTSEYIQRKINWFLTTNECIDKAMKIFNDVLNNNTLS